MEVFPSNKELIITYSSPSVSFLLPSSGDHALSQKGSTPSELKLLGAIGTLVVRTTTKLRLLPLYFAFLPAAPVLRTLHPLTALFPSTDSIFF